MDDCMFVDPMHMKNKILVQKKPKIVSRCMGRSMFYEIKYLRVGEDEYRYGFGSWNRRYVKKWLNEEFEVVEVKDMNKFRKDVIDTLDELEDLKNSMTKLKEALLKFQENGGSAEVILTINDGPICRTGISSEVVSKIIGVLHKEYENELNRLKAEINSVFGKEAAEC